MKKYAAGIDLGGTTVKIGLFHTDGTILDKWEIPTRKEDGGGYILLDIASSIKKKLGEAGISVNELEGAGIDVPGAVLEGGIVNKCVNLGWGVIPVREQLSALLDGVPVEVGNDGNVAALGELWKGGGIGYRNLVMITLGTGVGGGIIIDGHIVTGTYGGAGEIGHIMVEKDETEQCSCGKNGCLEQYASATGVRRLALKIMKESDTPSQLRAYGEALEAKNIFDEAKNGDALALQVVEEFGEKLGRACSVISCVVDPQIFVIGGGVSKAGQIILDTIIKYYKKDAFHTSRETKFALATLGNDSGMYGSVKMILDMAAR